MSAHSLPGRRSGSLAGILVVALGGLLESPGVVAQEQELSLGEPVATHPEPFSLVNTVRELSDGRVIVADPLERALRVLSPDLRTRSPLGRVGEGPEEYRQPDSVWPLPGDSTLLVDLGNARLVVMAPDGRFVRTRPILLDRPEPGRPVGTVLPRGVDDAGRIYFRGPAMATGGGPTGSVDLLRLDPSSEETRVVGSVRPPEMHSHQSGGGGSRQVRAVPIPLAPADGWAVAPDGRVAIVHSDRYRVEWRSEAGSRMGPAVPYDPVPIRTAEREEWERERERVGGVGMMVQAVGGQVNVTLQRMSGGGGPLPSDLTWPPTKPPFVEGSPRVDPEGRLWVRRSQAAGLPALYDVFDEAGDRVASVRFPESRELVGFGRDGLYAVRVDELDLVHLERYAFPIGF